jgi:hypothetical protein
MGIASPERLRANSWGRLRSSISMHLQRMSPHFNRTGAGEDGNKIQRVLKQVEME